MVTNEAVSDADAVANYGRLPTTPRTGKERAQIASISADLTGTRLLFRARVHAVRAQGKKVFLKLRQRLDSIQALAIVGEGDVSRPMVKWISGLAPESIVLLEGVVQKTGQPIRSATVTDAEILVEKIFLEAEPQGQLPFDLDDAIRPEEDFEAPDSKYNRVHLDTRLNNRVLDLRTPVNQAVFKMQAAIVNMFRSFLNDNGFTAIHSPKLQGTATESGASVFKVSYFKGEAFLAQSPQLGKQMAIAADFEKVYEIGPVFRAENANTHRHLTEYVGLDLEMTIQEHYHEVMEMLDSMFLSIFKGLRETCAREIDLVGAQFPAEPFKWREGPEGTLKLTFAEAVDLLVEDGVERSQLDDIDTVNEKRLGRVVREKYDTDYFIIDKFPLNLRPFYAMADPNNPELSNSYDFFMRGEEILSGGQRVHDPVQLIAQMKERGIDPASMSGYLNAFRLGCPPHGGGGIGLERVLMLFLKLNNIRRASLFPRDPRRLEP